jgi:phosphoribosylanthranilate isomerase
MTRIKVCGITNLEDASQAVELGVDALGFIFAPSPRRIEEKKAKEICDKTPPFISKVGVFVNEDKEVVLRILKDSGLDTVQFHGEEPPEYCREFKAEGVKIIKTFRVKDRESLKNLPYYEVDAYLLDTHLKGVKGGTGKTFNWDLALEAKKLGKPTILSGGLNPDNVRSAIEKVRPYAVDVASGVEKEPGRKDYEKMRKFVGEARL